MSSITLLHVIMNSLLTVEALMGHAGIAMQKEARQLLNQGGVVLNGKPVSIDQIVFCGDKLQISGTEFEAIEGGAGRLQLALNASHVPSRIGGLIRVHAGYHKCLTEYAKRVYRKTCRSVALPRGSAFHHYYHRDDFFYQDCHRYTISSISGCAVDLDRFENIRVVRFVRDPRDLLVSGYFYHKRSAEHWCDLKDPVEADWRIVGGAVPAAIPSGLSFAEYLNQVSLEEGLMAEMDFRQFHFDSMLKWPKQDSRVKLFRYEEILGNEAKIFSEIFHFFEFPWLTQQQGKRYARRFSAAQEGGKAGHIRDASHGQWRRHFTPALAKKFQDRYGELLDVLGYPAR